MIGGKKKQVRRDSKLRPTCTSTSIQQTALSLSRTSYLALSCESREPEDDHQPNIPRSTGADVYVNASKSIPANPLTYPQPSIGEMRADESSNPTANGSEL
jgi:hypothetical protein